MKMYLLTTGVYTEDMLAWQKIIGIFSTEDKASEACARLDVTGCIHEIEVDEIRVYDWDGQPGTERIKAMNL